MHRFAEYFVDTIFYDAFRGMWRFAGAPIELLKSTCEVVYQDAAARDRQDQQAMEDQAEAEEESTN